MQEAEEARSRLAFEELLVLQLRLLLQRTSAQCALAPLPCPALHLAQCICMLRAIGLDRADCHHGHASLRPHSAQVDAQVVCQHQAHASEGRLMQCYRSGRQRP